MAENKAPEGNENDAKRANSGKKFHKIADTNDDKRHALPWNLTMLRITKAAITDHGEFHALFGCLMPHAIPFTLTLFQQNEAAQWQQ
ncbi:CLUMA_CG014757, isoform A [Clunio marinus]|uniref:CLUMA_CG014757, isoform A n=1 Tax=Clunio marinus TaxID=568069 RepID=A0A1J1ILD3_9DIPT|nr:CLUMA_CG014757, isoform A [Clunio marinus]